CPLKYVLYLVFINLHTKCYARVLSPFWGGIIHFVSLLNPSMSVETEILQDCYEAFAMYCFGRYLIACLGIMFVIEVIKCSFFFLQGGEKREGRAGVKSPLLEQSSEKGTINHIFPMNLLKFLEPWQLGQRVYQIMKAGIETSNGNVGKITAGLFLTI
ncbi:Organic solute transporter Ost-alpha, partial [Cynara cardunculus var. scolymus]